MLNFIKNLITKTYWFKDQVQIAHNKGYWEAREESKRSRQITEDLRRENFLHVGGKVICVSNEWDKDNLIRAEVIGFGVHDIPEIRNIDTGEEFLCFGATLPYHDEMYAGLLKLNPFERYSIITAHNAISADNYLFGKKKLDPNYV